MAVLILNFGRCSHRRCFFCGYGRISGSPPKEDDIKKRFRQFFKDLGEDRCVKVFGSGSFLDEAQIPSSCRREFIRGCREAGVKEVTIESRPEYISSEKLAEFSGLDLTVAIGLESASEDLLRKLEKGFGKKEFEEAARVIRESNARVRTYLLVNPPHCPDNERQLEKSVEYALKHSDSLVLINLLPHFRAPLSRLWMQGSWSFLSKKEFTGAVSKWADDPRIEADAETFRFIPSFDDSVKDDLSGVGEWYLTHPHYEVWFDYLTRWYEPWEKRILLFLPCSYSKPYSKSATHRGIIERIKRVGRDRFHEVMISNAGCVPREFESRYPFESYDWDERLETEAIKQRYIQVTYERIRGYLTAHGDKYLKVACFLKPESESYKALQKACDDMGLELLSLLGEGPWDGGASPLRQKEALDELEKRLRWCLQSST